MNIEELEQQIKSAQMYYNFWNLNRHLPTAAQSADFFADRLKKLKDKLNECKQKSKQDHTNR